MPNLKSAKKRMRVSERQRKENYAVRSRVRRHRRRFLDAVLKGEKEIVQQAFSEYCSILDKAAKRNVIKKNTAIRYKARAAAKLRAVVSAASAA